MPTNERAIKGEKNKKTTDDVIPGKEKAKDRREESLPLRQPEAGKPSPTSNRDEPKAEKQSAAQTTTKIKATKNRKRKMKKKRASANLFPSKRQKML
jgi:hypothetical protein